MKEYKFEVYYKYDGRSVSDLFAEEKNPEQIQEALLNFENEVSHYIESFETTAFSSQIEGDNERKIITIKTNTEEKKVKESVKRCLQNLDLRAKML
jgi:hypothetical protein